MSSLEDLGRLVATDLEDGIRLLRIERPRKLNALNSYLWGRLIEELEKACRDKNVKAIVLAGTSKAFSVGDDIYEMYELADRLDARRFFELVGQAVGKLIECPKLVIAAVEGYAYGGGFEILLACDIVVSSKSARFSAPEARLGLYPPLLSTLGVLVLGLRRAKSLAVSAVSLSAEEARSMGIVDIVVGDGEALEKAIEIARTITSEIPVEAIETIKQVSTGIVRRLLGGELEKALQRLEELSISERGKEYMGKWIEERRKRHREQNP